MILRKKSCAIMAYALTFFVILLMQTSCIYDNNDIVQCSSEGTEALVINLNLTVPSSHTGTRSADDGLSPSTKDECYIDIENGDYKVLMFDKNGNLVEDKLSEFKCKENGVSGSSVSYTLTAHLKLSDNDDKELLSKFSIMVLTNWKSFETSNTRSSFDYPSFSDYNLSNIYKENKNLNFTLGSDNSSWVPSIADGKAIPMFGVTDKLDLQNVMAMAQYGDEPCFRVPLLRAVAKVEIVDEIGDKIGSVSMSNANQSGRFIPDIDENTAWNDDSKQIETPSLPEEVGNINKIEFVPGPKTADKKNTWVAYIAEMDLTKKRPEFTIYDGQTALPPTPFTNYIDKKPVEDTSENALKSVLRNHIYRYNVTINDSGIEIISEIQPWDKNEVPTWNFENAKIIDYLSWKTKYTAEDNVDEEMIGKDNGYNDKPDVLKLIMKPGITDYAEGTFKLEAPVGARWYAELISLNQDHHNSFQFVGADGEPFKDSDGNTVNYATGIINGIDPQIIRIKNLSEKVYYENNEARLVITIEYPDKTRKEVYVVAPDTGGNNYTIVQEITEFV